MKLLEQVKKFDRFGESISVNYRGRDKFKTLVGLFATIFNFLIIVNFSVTKLLLMVTRESQGTSDIKTFIDLEESPEVVLTEGKFQIGLTISAGGSPDSSIELDPRLGSLLVGQIKFDQTIEVETETDLFNYIGDSSASFCDESLWPQNEETQKIAEKLKVKCFSNEYSVKGGFLNSAFQIMYIRFYGCEEARYLKFQSTQASDKTWRFAEENDYFNFDCFTPEEALQYLQEKRPSINLITTQNYVDFDDIDNPFKQQIQSIFIESVALQPNLTTKAYISVAQNKLEVFDNYFQAIPSDKQEWDFLTLEEKSVTQYPTFGDISEEEQILRSGLNLEIRVQLSSSFYQYSRVTENIWDVLSDIGGFFDVISVALGFLLAIYSSAAFESHLASMTDVRVRKPSSHERSQGSLLQELSDRLASNENTRLQKHELASIAKQFRQIKKVKVSIFSKLARCLCKSKTKEHNIKLEVGKRFDKLLDIRRIARQQIDFKILLDKLLTPSQRLLMRFQHKRVEEVSDSTSSDYSKDNRNLFIQKMVNFRTANYFERKLLQGLIPKIKDSKAQASTQMKQAKPQKEKRRRQESQVNRNNHALTPSISEQNHIETRQETQEPLQQRLSARVGSQNTSGLRAYNKYGFI